MKTLETNGTFDDVVAETEPAARRVAERVRALIEEVWPETVEVHVDLGFNHGAALPDPGGVLGGTGKRFRHVKLSTEDDVARPEIRALLEAAVEERRAALAQDG